MHRCFYIAYIFTPKETAHIDNNYWTCIIRCGYSFHLFTWNTGKDASEKSYLNKYNVPYLVYFFCKLSKNFTFLVDIKIQILVVSFSCVIVVPIRVLIQNNAGTRFSKLFFCFVFLLYEGFPAWFLSHYIHNPFTYPNAFLCITLM